LGKVGGCDVTVWWQCGRFVVRNFRSPSCHWSSAKTPVVRIAGADGFTACARNSTVVVSSFIPVSFPVNNI